MIVGILSDTHGFADRAAAAVELLQSVGAEAFIHCGDVGGERVLDVFAGLPTWFVWGNSDTNTTPLGAYARAIGLHAPDSTPVRIEMDDRVIAVFHGHERAFERLLRLIRAEDESGFNHAIGDMDYILHGHTHRASDAQLGRARLINPGALHRAKPHTVATLDLQSDELTFLIVPGLE